jgi:hypothetical protein
MLNLTENVIKTAFYGKIRQKTAFHACLKNREFNRFLGKKNSIFKPFHISALTPNAP